MPSVTTSDQVEISSVSQHQWFNDGMKSIDKQSRRRTRTPMRVKYVDGRIKTSSKVELPKAPKRITNCSGCGERLQSTVFYCDLCDK
eukprot:5359366-Karenia_brevis.AAC.1